MKQFIAARLKAFATRRPPYAPVPPDPLDHPALRNLSPRALADLPMPRPAPRPCPRDGQSGAS
ncbi:hypothetical protein [Tropicimonas isoalkanivorans]|uniref:hypothetical protein n=1 Tax=Tropicimonas isoalkanivorans TaxID=441112 RepID=UPI0011605C20|nr:hypothetical protein [Tropicimonas isoalkanivorans]